MDIVERLKNADGDGQLLGDAVEEIIMLRSVIAETSAEISRIRNAITETLEESRYLSDGENCTLIKLKRVMNETKQK